MIRRVNLPIEVEGMVTFNVNDAMPNWLDSVHDKQRRDTQKGASPSSSIEQFTERNLWPGVGGACLPRQTLEGSFSAVSTPIFAIKYSFCSIFQDLQNELAEFSKFWQNFAKFWKFCKIMVKFSDFCKFFWIFDFFWKFWQILKIQLAHPVDLEKCCKMSIWLLS